MEYFLLKSVSIGVNNIFVFFNPYIDSTEWFLLTAAIITSIVTLLIVPITLYQNYKLNREVIFRL